MKSLFVAALLLLFPSRALAEITVTVGGNFPVVVVRGETVVDEECQINVDQMHPDYFTVVNLKTGYVWYSRDHDMLISHVRQFDIDLGTGEFNGSQRIHMQNVLQLNGFNCDLPNKLRIGFGLGNYIASINGSDFADHCEAEGWITTIFGGNGADELKVNKGVGMLDGGNDASVDKYWCENDEQNEIVKTPNDSIIEKDAIDVVNLVT